MQHAESQRVTRDKQYTVLGGGNVSWTILIVLLANAQYDIHNVVVSSGHSLQSTAASMWSA